MKKIFYAAVIYFLILISNKVFAQWERVYHEVIPGGILSFAESGNTIIAGTGSGSLLISNNNGDNWDSFENGLFVSNIFSLAASGDTIFLPSAGVLLISTNMGISWQNKLQDSGERGHSTPTIAKYSDSIYIYVSDRGNLFISTNYGDTWTQKYLKVPGKTYPPHVSSISLNSNFIVCGVLSTAISPWGIYISTDMGDNWKATEYGVYITCTAVSGDTIFAGGYTSEGGILISSDTGETWKCKNNILKGAATYTECIAISGDNIFFGTRDGLFLSSDRGNSWESKHNGFVYDDYGINALLIKNDYIFAGTDRGSIYRAKLSDLITDVNDSPTPSDEIALFPNPARDYIGIEIAEYSGMIEGANYSILNLLGQTMQSGTLAEAGDVQGECRISVESLPTGIYFLILKDSQAGTFVPLKFIKQ